MESKATVKKAVQVLLDDKLSVLITIIELHLINILVRFRTERLVPVGLYEDVVNGVTGVTTNQQAAKVVVALRKKLKVKPQCIEDIIAIVKEFEEDFAKELDQQYKGL